MKVFVIMALCYYWASFVSCTLSKCCPEGEIVQSLLVCENISSLDGSSDIPKFNKISVLKDLTWYNVQTDNKSHWPNCDSKITTILLSFSAKISQSSCIDKMNSKTYIFTCEKTSRTDEQMREVLKLGKCCDNMNSYDSFTHQCVENYAENVESNLSYFFGNKTIVFESRMPSCKFDEVLIEYDSILRRFEFREDSLFLEKLDVQDPISISFENFCIESKVNSKTNSTESDKSSQFNVKNSSEWIVKACLPIKSCETMPCVQKCCPEGQKYNFEDDFCENHSKYFHLQFHSKTCNTSGKTMEPPGDIFEFTACYSYLN